MAYDPEARQTGNSAMIISIVALVLLAGAALAYFATRNNEPDTTINSTTINRTSATPTPGDNTVVIAPTPNIIVVPGKTVVVPVPGKTVTRVERNTTVINRTVPAPSTSSQPSGSSSSPNVTTNTTPPSGTVTNNAAAAPSHSVDGATTNDASNSAPNSTTGY